MEILSSSRRQRWRQRLLSTMLILAIIGLPSMTAPPVVMAQGATFQTGEVDDSNNPFLTFPFELEEEGGPGGPPPVLPLDASMTANFSNITVIPGGGVIGGDVLEFDVTIVNTSPGGSGIVLSAFAFQSKFSESPALGSRIGDKLFYATVVPGPNSTPGQMGTVKKNGTSNGLFTGKWKGICINSSTDFIPEFNSGLEDESLECAGNRADTNFDGEPELLTGANMLGLRPGESQTIRLRLDSGTTDGALHVVKEDTLTGAVQGIPVIGPNGVTYYDVQMATTGTVLEVVEFGDNKVLRQADGAFDPTFAPLADGLSFNKQRYLTLPRRNFAFTDIIGRNHTCATYGLPCSGSPLLGFLGTGDLAPGVQNFAAILRGFGEFYDPDNDFVPNENPPGTGETRPNFPYNVLCENCGGVPYVPIAEFYVDNGGGELTRQIVAGTYGDPVTDPYLATIDSLTATEIKQEIIPEPDPGGPCLSAGRKPACTPLGGKATGVFRDLTVVPGAGINGGDAIEFTIDITNNSPPNVYLTAFNYQTKERGLADIGTLDGFTQDRKDIRVDSTLTSCTNLSQGACYNPTLGIGHFPNVIGNGLLFGQMVWTNANAGREPDPVDSDQVYVNPATGINPTPFRLESVKKNGPFSPILKGNENFICVKSGLFDLDPDSDAACAGQPAILIDPDGDPIPSNIDTSNPANPTGRLGLPPGQSQSVRIRMEFGDFRGALLKIVAGTLNAGTTDPTFDTTQGLARFFDCSDQRELEFCHPHLVDANIGYLPSTNATWLTPTTLEQIEYVIINQPGDAPTVMNFQQNFGVILAMAGFVPSAEFYAPDPNPELIGTPYEGVLIRQQVLGQYTVSAPLPAPAVAPLITSAAVTLGDESSAYSYQVTSTGSPAPTYSLTTFPAGMTINSSTGLISWPSPTGGAHDVEVAATNSAGTDTQSFQVNIASTPPLSQPPVITSSPTTSGGEGSAYSYQVTATGNPAPTFSLTTFPAGMTIDANSGLISWPSPAAGSHPVTVLATNGAAPDATQSFTVDISSSPPPPPPPVAVLDDFNRKDGSLGSKNWAGPGLKSGYKIVSQQVDVLKGGALFWKKKFGINQYAAVTLVNIDPLGSHGLILKAQGRGAGTAALHVRYMPQLNSIIVESKIPKKKVAIVGAFPATMSNGDQLSALATSDGRVEVFVNGVSKGKTGINPYFVNRKGGVGLWFHKASDAWLDNFDGGDAGIMAAGMEAEEFLDDADFEDFEDAWYNDIEEEAILDRQLFLPFVSR